MKIAFFSLEEGDQEYFKNSLTDSELLFFDDNLDENNLTQIKDVDAMCIFVDSEINKSVIDALPNLRFIATRSTGFNNIDVEYAKEKGIKVATVPAYGAHTVAEFTFGLILNLSRNVSKANNFVRQSADFHFFPMMEGFDLAGKTLGVIGTGKIGKNMIRIAKGFGMNVLAYDLHPDLAFAKENDFLYKEFTEVLAGADIITLHAPYTKENHHLINKENISIMKKGAYLINTARGELIDTDALIWGLQEKIIAGAGLDVLEGEHELKEEVEIFHSPSKMKTMRTESYKMLLEDHILMDMPNVIITPHIAFYTREAVSEILKVTVQNIQAFSSGFPINVVN